MSDMVEKVARAIYYAENTSERPDWEREPPSVKNHIKHKARAAIEAMREPTEEMERAGDETGCFVGSDEDVGYHGRKAGIVFTAMIDAALSPKGDEK